MWQTPYWLALGIWGGLVALGSLAALALILLVPGDPHAGVTPKILVIIFAGQGLVYGVSQIRKAMKERQSLAKEKHDA